MAMPYGLPLWFTITFLYCISTLQSMSKTKHKPPSRIRYEKNNPIVSFRIEKRLYKELKALLKNQGMSIGDFFRVALKKQQVDFDKLAGFQYDKGYDDGYDNGFGSFEMPCNVCGKPILFDVMTEPETEQIVREAFANWGHSDCLNE